MSNPFAVDDRIKAALDREYQAKHRLRYLLTVDQSYFVHGEDPERYSFATVTAAQAQTLRDNYYFRGDGEGAYPTP